MADRPSGGDFFGTETGWPEGYERRVLTSVDSTLSEAARVALELAGPEWILALEQTAARGRRGRAWAMPVGNFAATLVMPLAGSAAQAALRAFVMALALHEACVAVTGRAEAFALKWPNDVLMRGGKLAGILLETVGPAHLAIGVGVNLAAAPGGDEVEPGAVPPVALKSLGVDVASVPFLDLLASAFARYEAQFATYGFAPIRAAWQQHAARMGEAITARTTRDAHHGTFVDVDGDGQLVLETARGRVHIPAADVYF